MKTLYGSRAKAKHRRRLVLSGALGALLGLATTFGFAASLSVSSQRIFVGKPGQLPPTCSGSATLVAVADAWIDEKDDTTNYGASQQLYVESNKKNLRTLVRFDLSSIPANCTVTSATLRLFASNSDDSRSVQVYRAAAAWAENTVTWNNQPTVAGPPVTQPAGDGWRSWNVTSQVAAMRSGTNTGFILRDAVENEKSKSQIYSSREGASSQRPQLIVDWN